MKLLLRLANLLPEPLRVALKTARRGSSAGGPAGIGFGLLWREPSQERPSALAATSGNRP
jgi:hypothetical protein